MNWKHLGRVIGFAFVGGAAITVIGIGMNWWANLIYDWYGFSAYGTAMYAAPFALLIIGLLYFTIPRKSGKA